MADPINLPLVKPGAYMIWNRINGKAYIGISQNVQGRLMAHARGLSPKRLKTAIQKYGALSFVVTPLFYADDTIALPSIEANLIKEFDAVRNGYNVAEAFNGVGPYGELYNVIQSVAAKRRYSDPIQRIAARELATEINARPGMKERKRAAVKKLIWITNGLKSTRIKRGSQVPNGWHEGMHLDGSVVWITNGNENRRHPITQEIPSGWYAGMTRKIMLITNGVRNRRLKQGREIPDGWHEGTSIPPAVMWITNGVQNTRVARGAQIPEGWRKGLTHGKITLSN